MEEHMIRAHVNRRRRASIGILALALSGPTLAAPGHALAGGPVNGPLVVHGAYPTDDPEIPGDLLTVQSGGHTSPLVKNVFGAGGLAASPHGDALAIAQETHGLWTVKSDGKDLRRLVATPRSRGHNTLEVDAVAWSPDGLTVAFAVDAAVPPAMGGPAVVAHRDPAAGVYFTTADGRAPIFLATSAQLGAVDGAGAPLPITRLSFSSDGGTVAVSTSRVRHGTRTPVVLLVDSGSGRTVYVVSGGRDGVFDPSPGSPLLAYVSGRQDAAPGVDPGTALHTLDKSGDRVLLRTHDTLRSPVWAPNGASIAYSRFSYAPRGDSPIVNDVRTVDVSSRRVQTDLGPGAPRYGLWTALAWLPAAGS